MGASVVRKSAKIQNMFVPAKLVRKRMNNYFDKYGRLHDKPCVNGEPSSNNGWIYTAYYMKSGNYVDSMFLYNCFRQCKQVDPNTGRLYLVRSPFKDLPPMSRDEILGFAALNFLKPSHLNGWSFSPYPIPPFSLKTLIKQVLELRGQHRNYFWKNKLDQIYRFAFSVPLSDRAFLLECFGETRSLRYFFYKAIAFLDSKIGKPVNGIPWLKYGGDERKEIMKTEFPEDHPLRQV